MQKHLAVSALVMLILGVYAVSFTPRAFASWLVDASGTLIQLDSSVLGDETDTNSALSRQIEARQTIQVKTGQTSTFNLEAAGDKLRVNQELKNATGSVIRRQSIEVKQEESLNLQQEDGQTARINAVSDGQLEIVRNRIKAKTNLELQVGEKNEISVTLPNGNLREIAIPDQALARLIANGVITQIEGEESAYELIAGRNGEPVYLAEGLVEKKLLGIPFLKLKFAQKLEVAAGDSEDGTVTTGDIVNSETLEISPWRRFLESLTR